MEGGHADQLWVLHGVLARAWCCRRLGRQLTILRHEDDFTRKALSPEQRQCFGWVPGVAVGALGAVLDAAQSAGLRLANCRSIDFAPGDAERVLGNASMSGFGVALKLVGRDARELWGSVVLSPPSGVEGLFVAATEEADEAAITAVFRPVLKGSATGPTATELSSSADAATSTMSSTAAAAAASTAAAAWGPSSEGSAAPLCASALRSTAVLSGCTAAVVLPHIVSAGRAGAVLQATLDGASSRGLRLTAVELVDLDPVTAGELLEVYDGVEPSFPRMVEQVAKGPALALELAGADAVRKLREVAGPRDVDVGRKVRPDTVRSLHGVDAPRCALHVTDLDEDGPVDSEYLFSVL